jgi:tRNA pseudouridine38-40 synthase
MNVKITIAYDGFDFCGSQKQPNKNSIEDKLLEAFKKLNVEEKIILSGRTDKQVHATGQVFNIHLPKHFHNMQALQKALNHLLPLSIRIINACIVKEDFHARFSAKKRVYRYFMTTQELSAFNARYITYTTSINEQKIKEAMKLFLGEHDFEYFQKNGSDKHHFIKYIYEARFYQYRGTYIFKFKANSYLRSQIRLMVGFLVEISQGKLQIQHLQEQLQKTKQHFKRPIEGYGLYLAKVVY